jgi:hypothetical protein
MKNPGIKALSILVVAYLFSIAGEALCQSLADRYLKLQHRLLSADSVLLVSHEDTAGFIENPDGTASPTAPLILNGKVNTSIIKERTVLDKKKLTKLSNLLTAKMTKFSEQAAGCFRPHHSIVLIEKGKYSYIELCFQCERLKSSPDIDFSDSELNERKWNKLKQFFLENHFKYELK